MQPRVGNVECKLTSTCRVDVSSWRVTLLNPSSVKSVKNSFSRNFYFTFWVFEDFLEIFNILNTSTIQHSWHIDKLLDSRELLGAPSANPDCSHDTVNCSTVAQWFKQFQVGRRSTEDYAHTSRPSATIGNTSIVILFTLLNKDRWMTVWGMEGVSGAPKTTICCILTEYLMKKMVVAQWVLHVLFPAWKQHCIELCQKHLTHYEKEGITFLQWIISIDETWVYDFKP